MQVTKALEERKIERPPDIDLDIKVFMLGSCGSGKTRLVEAYSGGAGRLDEIKPGPTKSLQTTKSLRGTGNPDYRAVELKIVDAGGEVLSQGHVSLTQTPHHASRWCQVLEGYGRVLTQCLHPPPLPVCLTGL